LSRKGLHYQPSRFVYARFRYNMNIQYNIILQCSGSQTMLRGAPGRLETNLGAPRAQLNQVHILIFVKLLQVTFILYNVCILAIY